MHMNLNTAFLDAVDKYKDNIYIKTPEYQLTYGEFYLRVASLHNHLKEMGVEAGNRVAIITEKSPEQLTAFYAVWSLGGIAVPINESLGKEETRFILEDCDPVVTITSPKFFTATQGLISPVVSFEFLDEDLSERGFTPADLKPQDLAALIYTSGSTGNPKGVMTTHENFIVNARSAADYVGIDASDSFYSLLPFWHAFALTVEVIIPVITGAGVYFAKGQRDFAKNIPNYEPSIILAVPRILEVFKGSILKKVASDEKTEKIFKKAHDFMDSLEESSSLIKKSAGRLIQKLIFKKVRSGFGGNFRFFISGGAPLDRGLQTFFGNMGINITQGYGLSETSPIISVDSPENLSLGSVGPILSWMTPEMGGDFTFMDDNGNKGKDLEGELLVKGRCVMKGYWNYTDGTAKTTDEDGWLHTGDVGVLDDQGKLYIRGRRSNMIVLAGGEKVHPEHIEDLLKKSEHIDDVMIIGEKCKNLYACVTVPEESFTLCNDSLRDSLWSEIKTHTRHLAPYQKPKDFIVLPNFTPENGTYTGTMKIRRHVIKEIHKNEIRSLLKSSKEEAETA